MRLWKYMLCPIKKFDKRKYKIMWMRKKSRLSRKKIWKTYRN